MAASTPTTLSTNKRYFTGEDALHRVDDYIFEFEKNTLTSFVKVKAPKKIELPARCELASRRVFWEEHSSNEFPLAFDGVPFFVLGCQVRECCHGPDRHRASKNKAARIKSTSKDMLAVRMRQTTEDRKSEEYKEENGQHNETAETCRKRKRKDERKSSIFMYEIPKKSSRIPELKYCVCRKVNDGRKYWNCEDCMKWYHPECMGYKREEEPDTYICPGCQVEKKKFWQKNCPSWSEVEEELMESLRIEEADPYDESHMGDLQETHRGLTAMCLNNPAVQFFLDTQRQKGKSIENKQTGWGPFILLDEEKLEECFSFRSNVNVEELLAVSDALRYFMDKFGKNIKVMHVSENVVQMHPGHAVEKYKEWLKEMKEELSS